MSKRDKIEDIFDELCVPTDPIFPTRGDFLETLTDDEFHELIELDWPEYDDRARELFQEKYEEAYHDKYGMYTWEDPDYYER